MTTMRFHPTNAQIVKSFPTTGFIASVSSFLLATFQPLEEMLTLISLFIGVVLGILGIVGWFWKNRDFIAAVQHFLTRKKTPNE